jgi:hypothetical protein
MTIREPECVALKRRGAEHVAKLLAGKSPGQQLEFWQQRTQALLARQAQEKKAKTEENAT